MYKHKLSKLLFESKNKEILMIVSEQTSAVDLLTDLLGDLGDDEKKEIFDNVFSNLEKPDAENISKQLEDDPDLLQKVLDDPDVSDDVISDLKDDGDLLDKLGVDSPDTDTDLFSGEESN